MKNERNAGRKPKIDDSQWNDILIRHEAGENLAKIAREYGISRQALSRRFRDYDKEPVRIDYYVDGKLSTLIEADFRKESVHVVNYASELSKTAFGYELNPNWEDFVGFIEDYYLEVIGLKEADEYGQFSTNKDRFLLSERTNCFSLDDIAEKKGEKGKIEIVSRGDDGIPVFRLQRKDILLTRSDTDGFQMKALSSDRRLFIKSQAIIAGVEMRDWAVEIIATFICEQLGIPCIKQKRCCFVYGKRKYDGVCSSNFALDGYCFLSFESLLERMNTSSNDDAFIQLDAISKLKWCAHKLSEIGEIPYSDTERYMIDMAVLDCLVGNVDRHTRNFGLFCNTSTSQLEIPPIFDSGMGLFEHDYYRDKYESYEEAMNNVYVAPYGEDPFEMMRMLDEEYSLKELYKDVDSIEYGNLLNTPFALEYERRMNELWQKLG